MVEMTWIVFEAPNASRAPGFAEVYGSVWSTHTWIINEDLCRKKNTLPLKQVLAFHPAAIFLYVFLSKQNWTTYLNI